MLPRTYLPPAGYPSPKHVVWGIHCNTVNATTDERSTNQDQDQDQDSWQAFVWSTITINWINFGGPTFFLGEETLQLLRKTKPPEDVEPEELKLPFPAFALILPETERWPLLILSTLSENRPQLDPDKSAILKRMEISGNPSIHSVQDIYTSQKSHMPGPDYLAVMRGKPSGRWEGTWCAITEEKMGQNIQKHEEKIEEFYKDKPKKDIDSVSQIGFATNFLCWLKYCYLEKESIPELESPKIHKSRKSKKVFLKPLFLGERKEKASNNNISSPVTYSTQEQRPPETHWRKGHWHWVLYGRNKKLRKRDWFKPVLVNPPKNQKTTC